MDFFFQSIVFSYNSEIDTFELVMHDLIYRVKPFGGINNITLGYGLHKVKQFRKRAVGYLTILFSITVRPQLMFYRFYC